VTLLVLGTVQGAAWGWGSDRTVALLAVAAVVTALTVARTLRHPHALIERDLFTSRPFTGASVALFVFFIGFAIFLLSVVLFLQGPPPRRCSRSTRAASGRGSAGCCPRWRARCSWRSRPATGCSAPARARTTR
jgi:hypothetical protein